MALAALLLLLIVLGVEIGVLADLTSAGPAKTRGQAVVVSEPPGVEERSTALVQLAVSKPLFEPARKVAQQVATVERPVPAPPSPPVRRAPPPVLPSLTALMADGERALALFRLPSGELRMSGEGEAIGGWTVVSIGTADVRLAAVGREATVPLRPAADARRPPLPAVPVSGVGQPSRSPATPPPNVAPPMPQVAPPPTR